MKGEPMSNTIIPSQFIEERIFLIRGQKVMLDRDLAHLYGVQTSYLNKTVSRNLERFPEDFMFQLTKHEFDNLMFQFGTSSWGGTRKFPRVFTEQGISMLSSVLRSKEAIQVNIAIMRVFVKLREILNTNKQLAQRLDQLEKRMGQKDQEVKLIFEAIRQLMQPPETPKRKIGFHTD
jgi:hypothetical protein